MSAKILAFDPNRRIPPRHYIPIAMRGRLLQMPTRNSGAVSEIEEGSGAKPATLSAEIVAQTCALKG
jgi:hypothetical protein